jgi:hypothetical protein
MPKLTEVFGIHEDDQDPDKLMVQKKGGVYVPGRPSHITPEKWWDMNNDEDTINSFVNPSIKDKERSEVDAAIRNAAMKQSKKNSNAISSRSEYEDFFGLEPGSAARNVLNVPPDPNKRKEWEKQNQQSPSHSPSLFGDEPDPLKPDEADKIFGTPDERQRRIFQTADDFQKQLKNKKDKSPFAFAQTGLAPSNAYSADHAKTGAIKVGTKDKSKEKEKLESFSLLKLYSLVSEGNVKTSAKNAKDPETLTTALDDLQIALDDINAAVPSLSKVVDKVLPPDIGKELAKGLDDLEQGALRTKQTAKTMKGKVSQLQSDFEDGELMRAGDDASREFGTAKPRSIDGSDATKEPEKGAAPGKTASTKAPSGTKSASSTSDGDDNDDFRSALAAIQGDDESPSQFLNKQKQDFLLPKSSQGVKNLLGTLPKDDKGKNKDFAFKGGDFPKGFQGAASNTGADVDPVDDEPLAPVVGDDGKSAWNPDDEKEKQSQIAAKLSTPGKPTATKSSSSASPSMSSVFSGDKSKPDDDDQDFPHYGHTARQPDELRTQGALNWDMQRNKMRTQSTVRQARRKAKIARGK